MSQLHIGLSLSPTWFRGDAWHRTDSRVDELFSPAFWRDAANLAEAAHLDFVLKPDALSVRVDALAAGVGFASPDPMSIMTLLIGSTERIGLVPTVSSRFTEPYDVARQLHSLDRFSTGRFGVNVVTSLGGGEQYASRAVRDEHTDLYADAQDFVDHIGALRRTFPAQAWLPDAHDRADQRARFADTSLMSAASPHGRFSAPGPLGIPALGADPLPMIHAGSSDAAVHFAARNADVLFAMVDTVEAARDLRTRLHDIAETYGRPAPLLCPGVSLQLGADRPTAEQLHRGPHAAHVTHWSITGTPVNAADEIARWFEAGAIDGCIALPTGSWSSLAHFTEGTVPLLSDRGLFRDRYRTATLHEHLREGRTEWESPSCQ